MVSAEVLAAYSSSAECSLLSGCALHPSLLLESFLGEAVGGGLMLGSFLK